MTKITYLKNAKNLQELKKLYFELSKKYHPDITGGNLEIMQIINNEYDYLKKILKNAEPKENESKNAYNENSKSMDAFRDMMNVIIEYPKITIEIVGSWLWISGTGTFKIKDDILYNMLHCKYSKSQKKFYWFNDIENNKFTPKGGYLKNAIDKYGKYVINSNNDPLPELT